MLPRRGHVAGELHHCRPHLSHLLRQAWRLAGSRGMRRLMAVAVWLVMVCVAMVVCVAVEVLAPRFDLGVEEEHLDGTEKGAHRLVVPLGTGLRSGKGKRELGYEV